MAPDIHRPQLPQLCPTTFIPHSELGERFWRIIRNRKAPQVRHVCRKTNTTNAHEVRRTGMFFRPWSRFMPPLRGLRMSFSGVVVCYRHAGPAGLRTQSGGAACRAVVPQSGTKAGGAARSSASCSLRGIRNSHVRPARRSLEENLVSRKRPAVATDHTLNRLSNRAPQVRHVCRKTNTTNTHEVRRTGMFFRP